MPQSQRNGFIDSIQQSRLNWLTGTAFPVAPAGAFLALYGGALPDSTGAGGSELTSAGRPAVTLGAVVALSDGRWSRTNSAPISFTVPAGTAPGTVNAWGIFGAATGGTANYNADGLYPYPYQAGQVITIPVGALTVLSERAP